MTQCVIIGTQPRGATQRHCNRMNKNMATEQDRNFNIRCYRRDTTFCAQDIDSENWTATLLYVLQEQAYFSREPICGDTTHTSRPAEVARPRDQRSSIAEDPHR